MPDKNYTPPTRGDQAERRGYIVLFNGTASSAPVTILHETPKQFVIRHETPWANRPAGDVRRMSKVHVREVGR